MLVLCRLLQHELLELPVEVGQGIEATFIADVRDRIVGFRQQLAGMFDAYLRYELRKRLVVARRKKTAE